MPSKIRVFVSSTMKDLANERDAVVRKIAELNFEPVDAESWLRKAGSFDERRYTSRGLRVVRSDADTFLDSLAAAAS